jgi:hypothetical protein
VSGFCEYGYEVLSFIKGEFVKWLGIIDILFSWLNG